MTFTDPSVPGPLSPHRLVVSTREFGKMDV